MKKLLITIEKNKILKVGFEGKTCKRERIMVLRSINGENQRKQRMVCCECHHVPHLRLEFVLECKIQRIRQQKRQIQCWISHMGGSFGKEFDVDVGAHW